MYFLLCRFNANYLNDAIDKTNAKYGALDIEASRIVYVHGSIDPWHILGLTETTENNSPAIYIKGKHNILFRIAYISLSCYFSMFYIHKSFLECYNN